MTTSLLKLAADFDTQLATASSIGATTATLVSATDDDGNALPTGLYGLTIDAGNSSKEYIICTLTSTALTGILSVTRQGVTSSGFARTHRRGAKVTLTDWAILKRMLNNLDGTTGFDSASPLSYDGNPTFTADGQIITKKYADDLAIAGSPDASTTVKGIGRVSVAPASPTIPIFVGDNDPRVPTTGENDALAGTSGTPSSSNKYVTENDVASDGTANKIIRAAGAAGTLPSSFVLDEDNMVSDSATKVPSQQSVKAYVDNSNLFATGQTSRAAASGTGNITIAHGLSKTPKFVRITAGAYGTSNPVLAWSVGTATGTSAESCTYFSGNSVNQYNSLIGFIDSGSGSNDYWTLDLTTLDSTNIVLAAGGFPNGTLYIQWEAYA